MAEGQDKTAKLYRMVMEQHLCPFGLKSKDLLERQGYLVEDHHLTTREETDAFMAKEGVETTPQTFIDGERIGGFDDLRVHFGLDKPKEEQSDTSYQPVIAIFGVAFLMALGIVVDDAIVIGENIYTHRRRNPDLQSAAVEGAYEVLPAVISSLKFTL